MRPPAILRISTGVGGILVLGYLLVSGDARAHDAPSGWTYPKACCSDMDCRAVSAEAITESPDGYVVGQTGEVLPYSDGRLRDSPDGDYHWCSPGGSETGRTICLFVPPHSF